MGGVRLWSYTQRVFERVLFSVKVFVLLVGIVAVLVAPLLAAVLVNWHYLLFVPLSYLVALMLLVAAMLDSSTSAN